MAQREELKLRCIDLSVPDTRRRIMQFVGSCKGIYDVVIEPRKPTRTGKQNAFMHGVLFTMLAAEMRSLGTEEADLDYAKSYLKDRFLREPVIDPSTGELLGYRTRETHKLNIDEGSRFIEQCIEHMTNYFNMTVPAPGEIIEKAGSISMSTELANAPTPVQATLPVPRMVLADDDGDTVAMKILAISAFEDRVKEFIREAKESVRLRLEEIGPVVVGDQFYWSARDKKPPKCQNIAATVELILNNVAGDFEAFCRHLASSPLKIGECRQTLGEAFEQHFTTEVVDKLESDTVTPKKLQNANKRFMDMQREKREALALHDAK